MPVDPNIALGAAPPAPPANPMAALGGVLQVQSQLNQNKLFAQTFMAKQKMGEMIATTPPGPDGQPDWDTIQQKFLSDPDVAPFAPQAMNEIRQLHLTNTQIAGQEQDQNLKGLGALQKALAQGYQDPSQIAPALQTVLASQPADIQKRLGPAVRSLVTGLTGNLPADPAAAKATVQSRIIGNQVAQGVTPETLSSLTGKQGQQDVGGALQQGVFAPPQQGGGFTPATVTPKTLAPQVVKGVGPTGAEQTGVIGGGLGLGGPASQGPGAGQAAGALGLTPVLQGPSASQSAYMGDRGKDMATYAQDLDNTVNEGGTLLKVVGEARQALQSFKPGGGGNTATNVATLMQGMNRIIPGMFSDQQIGSVAGGTLQDAEEFRKLMGQAVLQVTRQNLPQGSRLAVQEFQSFEKNNPNLDTDPRAIDKVFSFWTKIYNQNHAEQQALAQDQQQGGDIASWPSRWQDMQQKKGFINTNQKSYSSADDLRDDVAAGSLTPQDAIARGTAIWGADRSKWPRRGQ